MRIWMDYVKVIWEASSSRQCRSWRSPVPLVKMWSCISEPKINDTIWKPGPLPHSWLCLRYAKGLSIRPEIWGYGEHFPFSLGPKFPVWWSYKLALDSLELVTGGAGGLSLLVGAHSGIWQHAQRPWHGWMLCLAERLWRGDTGKARDWHIDSPFLPPFCPCPFASLRVRMALLQDTGWGCKDRTRPSTCVAYLCVLEWGEVRSPHGFSIQSSLLLTFFILFIFFFANFWFWNNSQCVVPAGGSRSSVKVFFFQIPLLRWALSIPA